MTDELDMRDNEEGFRAFNEIAPVTDVDDKTHQVVVDFPHEVIDGYRTDWGRGCWDESLAKTKPPMLWNHLPHELIGRGVRSENLGGVTRIVNRFSDFDAVPRAKQAFAQIRDGDVPGFSFHYRNGQSIRHPNVRGARRYTKADILETSPVTFPSIPGAGAVDIRSQEAVLEIPSIDTIMKLKTDGVIGDEGVRSLLEEHYPHLREHIVIGRPAELTPQQKMEAVLGEHAPDLLDGFRSLMTMDRGTAGTGAVDPGEDATVLVQAIDAALDSAADAVSGTDLTTLPDPVQQGLALMQAAGVAVDELQDVMGIEDPDGNRADKVSDAPWNYDPAKYTPEQLRSACLVVDGDGSTKDQCHLPVKEPDGALNKAAVHAAAGALSGARGGTKLSSGDKKAAADKLMGLYSKLGEKPPPGILSLAGSGSRADAPDPESMARVNEILGRRVPAA